MDAKLAAQCAARKAERLAGKWQHKGVINKAKYNAAIRKRQAAKLQRTAAWADEDRVQWFYDEAQRLEELTGIKFHVDHIIPLQGELASGLHVESNLQLLTCYENWSKNNDFDPMTFKA